MSVQVEIDKWYKDTKIMDHEFVNPIHSPSNSIIIIINQAKKIQNMTWRIYANCRANLIDLIKVWNNNTILSIQFTEIFI